MVLHNFIVFEGIDGAGTSTQLKILQQRPDKDRFVFTAEPTDMPTGRFLRSMLQGEIKLDPRSTAYLFAADRSEHLWGKTKEGNDRGIAAQCQQGKLVVSDRYFFSSLAYQSIDCGMELPLALNSIFPLPELLFFFDITPSQSLARVDSRGEREIYENEPFLKQVCAAYRQVLERYADSGIKIVVLDARESPEQLAAHIAGEIKSRYGI